MDSYITVQREAMDEFTVQKSRFLGYACPCETEEAALAFLSRIKAVHRGARHHCYAYIIGHNMGIMRYSDDGEPGGTAGMPMMDILRGQHVVNCCVVAVRYFGGILLGTGGLVRAYSQSARIALAAAGTVRMEWTMRDLCDLPYSCWDSVRHAMEKLPASFENVSFGATVSFDLLTREADRDLALDALQKASGRQRESIPSGEGYYSWSV